MDAEIFTTVRSSDELTSSLLYNNLRGLFHLMPVQLPPAFSFTQSISLPALYFQPMGVLKSSNESQLDF